jgi:hypothetical protein
MLRGDRLSAAERARALGAVEEALAACAAPREVARA